MKEYKIEEKEIFSLLTTKQIAEISDAAQIKFFDENDIIYDQKEQAKNMFILLEGEVALRLPSRTDMSVNKFSLELERFSGHGTVFGANSLFGIKRYVTRARATKSSKVMILDTEEFFGIIQKNKSEFPIMSYLAKIYFQRYIHAMKEFEQQIKERSAVTV